MGALRALQRGPKLSLSVSLLPMGIRAIAAGTTGPVPTRVIPASVELAHGVFTRFVSGIPRLRRAVLRAEPLAAVPGVEYVAAALAVLTHALCSLFSGREAHSASVCLSAPVRAIPFLSAGQRGVADVAGWVLKDHCFLLLQEGGTNLYVDDRVHHLLVGLL